MKTLKTLTCLLALSLTGCSVIRNHVIVSTTTVLGLEVAQNATTGLYQARLGYVRAELALVPTNNVDVLTEMRWNSIFTTGGLYQRMAIGKEACEQSIYMFIKDSNGNVNSNLLQTVTALTALKAQRHSTNN